MTTKQIVDGVLVNRDPRHVTIRIDLWEQQQRERAEYRRYLRDLDPCGLHLYDEDDDE